MIKTYVQYNVLSLLFLFSCCAAWSRTFDEAVEEVRRERADLARHDMAEEKEVVQVYDDRPVIHPGKESGPSITWQDVEWLIDATAFGYAAWTEYHLYKEVCNIQTAQTENPSLLQLVVMQAMPEWLKYSKLLVKSGPPLFEIYFYRTIALYTLNTVRYGIVMPISWLMRGVKALRKRRA